METEKNKRYIYVGDIVIVVRTSKLKPKDPDFNSCSEHQLDFALVVPRSTPHLRLFMAPGVRGGYCHIWAI